MQRRAFALQGGAGEVTEAPDPVEKNPSLLEGLETPALVLVGARDLPDFRVRAEALANALPRAGLGVIEGVGHLAPLETPEEFRSRLLAFLETAT